MIHFNDRGLEAFLQPGWRLLRRVLIFLPSYHPCGIRSLVKKELDPCLRRDDAWKQYLAVLLLIQVLKNLSHSFESPVKILLADDQWGSEADDILMGFLAEQSFLHKRFTKTPGASGLWL